MGVRLGNICRFQSGGTPSKGKPEFFNGTIPWITTTALNGGNVGKESAVDWISEQAIKESAAKIVPAFSIMVGTRVGVGKVAINTTSMSTSQDIVSLLDIDENVWSKAFLCKFLQAKGTFLNSQARGATIKGIKIDVLSELELPEIPMEEQQHISQIIDKIKAIIVIRQQQLQKLDELVKARFVELFGMPGTDDFGWGLVPLGSTCNINPKKSYDSRLVSGVEVSFVPMPAVTERGGIDTTSIKEYDEVKTGFTYFAENDVLFAKITPCMENGKGAVARGLHNGIGFGSTEFHVLRPISGKTNPYWIYTLTTFSQFRIDAANNMTGSAGQRRVPASFLENYQVSLPPFTLQEQFAAFVIQTDKSKLLSKMLWTKCNCCLTA